MGAPAVGINKIIHDNVPFYFYYRPTSSNEFFISLTDGCGFGRKDIPVFQRWKYQDVTNANILCFDDPMHYTTNEKIGLFFGTGSYPYYLFVSTIIDIIIRSRNIPKPKVMVYGSSSGGTAGLYLSSVLRYDSTVVAINGQLSETTLRSIIKRSSLSIDKDPYNRFNIEKIIKTNPQNKYVLLENVASDSDWRQIKYISDKYGIEPRIGGNKVDNLLLILYYAPTADPSNAQDWQGLFPFIRQLGNDFDSFTENEDISMYIDSMVECLYNHHRNEECYEIDSCKTLFNLNRELDYVISTVTKKEYEDNIDCKVILAHAYRDGKGVGKDLIKAEELYRQVVAVNPRWNKNLFDVLWSLKSPGSDEEMFRIAEAGAKAGDLELTGRLGKVYSAGRGTEKDILRAAELYRLAAAANPRWNMNLIDVLMTINTPESLMEVTDISMRTASSGCKRWDGKGIPSELGLFSEWVRRNYDRISKNHSGFPKEIDRFIVKNKVAGIKEYNFVVCSDRNLSEYLFVLLYSISRNCALPSTVYVLQSDYPEFIRQSLMDYSKQINVRLLFVDVNDSDFDCISVLSGRTKQWPNATYYYLMSHEYLPKDIGRALYLDIDTIVLKDVIEYYSVDFEGSVICASTEKSFTPTTNIATEKMVFNSGVLLLNLEQMRAEGICIEDYAKCASSFENGFFADQQIVNTMFFDRCKYLPRGYYNALINYTENIRSLSKTNVYSPVVCNDLDALNSIVHYIGRDTLKAWYNPAIVGKDIVLGRYPEKSQYLYHRIWWDYASNVPTTILKRILLKPKRFDNCLNKEELFDFLLNSKTDLNWLHILCYCTMPGRQQSVLDSIVESPEKDYFVKRYVNDLINTPLVECSELIDDAVKTIKHQ